MAAAQLVCPGDRLTPADSFAAGSGAYERDGFIYSARVGYRRTVEPEPSSQGGRSVIEVVSEASHASVPKPGDVVTVKVSRVQLNQTHCAIVCVGSQALESDFKGVIRLQDVRATEIDKVVMYDCFRPGDIVRAEVLSLGDARSYYLTTSKNELGVVYARSAAAGKEMQAVGWTEMQCPETMTVEKRKVAKRA